LSAWAAKDELRRIGVRQGLQDLRQPSRRLVEEVADHLGDQGAAGRRFELAQAVEIGGIEERRPLPGGGIGDRRGRRRDGGLRGYRRQRLDRPQQADRRSFNRIGLLT